ncbi:PREDICTED: motile sperm domain-containing protein 1-like [Nicrophorus vespilloides]|uniref:Motile sperm domain-containing protein 1-like n=1 Tax=Nicrophorus vespilloides TaxID=110193 RepID=A0ABM1MSN2_NICVS|nr:PREDICTED: motile sperm domain-containing protein 1-like [Nicrophorus vespilloides]
MDSSVRKVPVFVYPTTLKFFLGSRQSHKQLLTLYNPYEFRVRFKVLSTAPKKYMVIDPTGSIGPQACVDIVVRHTMPNVGNCNVVDKFRISMEDHTTKAVLGKRDIEARLLNGEQDNNSNDGDKFDTMPNSDSHSEDQRNVQYSMNMGNESRGPTSQQLMAIVIGIFCCLALLWPCQQDSPVVSTIIPPYMYITTTVKLVLAYILGLITIVIFRP